MNAFFILKPDLLDNTELLEEYKKMLQLQEYLVHESYLLINDWVESSLRMYDVSQLEPNKENIRKKMLITILGYYKYYKNKGAIIDLVRVDESDLIKMNQFKKDFREKYVVKSDKNYICINNMDIIRLSSPLTNVPLNMVEASYYKTSYDVEEIKEGYNLIYFNKLHCPDPNIDCVNRDLDILDYKKLQKVRI